MMAPYLPSEEADRVEDLFLRRDDPPLKVAVSGDFLTRNTPSKSVPRAPSRARSDSSISSTESSCFDNPQRRVSSAASDSTAPPLTGPPPWFRNLNPTSPDPTGYNYELPCEFSFAGCRMRFTPDHWGYWLSHSLSHFQDAGPPSHAICTFCDDPNAILEDSIDPVLNWRRRMIHMGGHFQNGQSLRPDYFVIDHMKTHGLIEEEDYKHAISYTERPWCENLVSRDYKTEEMRRRNEKIFEEKHDLGKEGRTIRRERKGKRFKYILE